MKILKIGKLYKLRIGIKWSFFLLAYKFMPVLSTPPSPIQFFWQIFSKRSVYIYLTYFIWWKKSNNTLTVKNSIFLKHGIIILIESSFWIKRKVKNRGYSLLFFFGGGWLIFCCYWRISSKCIEYSNFLMNPSFVLFL